VPDEDFTHEEPAQPAATGVASSIFNLKPFDLEQNREETRGVLARGLLTLLTFVIGGVLAFVGLGRLDGTVITQSVFPSLIALAGTALGFYFGSQVGKNSDSSNSSGTTRPVGAGPPNPQPPPDQN
jgi:hypothetical protein